MDWDKKSYMKSEKNIEKIIREIKSAERKVKSEKINLFLKDKLIKYLGKIHKIGGDYEMVYEYFEPKGFKNRSIEEEFDLFLKRKLKDKKYCPVFTYPEMAKLNKRRLKKDIAKLNKIREDVKSERNRDIKIVVLEVIKNLEAKINILVALKNGNPKKAFSNAVIAYGDTNSELVAFAKKCYKSRISFFSKPKKVSKTEKDLEKIKLNAYDIRKYFKLALKKGGLEKSKFKIIISKRVESIDVRYSNFEHKHPVILIPQKRRVCLIKIFELIAHEIGAHVTSNYYNTKCGLKGLSIGRDWETLNEGIAILNEIDIRKKILKRIDFEIKALPFFVLAIDKIKKGCSFSEIYDYIFKLRYKEYKTKGYSESISKKMATFGTVSTCRRIFRGFDPKDGYSSEMYFPKDASYLRGEIEAKKMREAGLDKYLYASKVDPKFIPNLIRLGMYNELYVYEKEIELAKNVAIYLWQDKFGNKFE